MNLQVAWPFSQKKKGERGVMALMAILGMTSILMSAGLAVDVSNFYVAGAELQNAADAAALAAASALNSTKPGITMAATRGTSVANKWNYNTAGVNITEANVRFAANLSQFDSSPYGLSKTEALALSDASTIRFVRVAVTPVNVKVYFAHVMLGTGSLSIGRNAVAGQSQSGCTASGTCTSDYGLTEVCNPNRIVLLEDDQNGGTLSTVGTCANSTVYTKGCTYNVTMTPPCDAVAATYELTENFFGAFPTNRTRQFAAGMQGCFTVNQPVRAWTHPDAAAIRHGLNTAFDVYNNTAAKGIPDTEWRSFPPDMNIRENITYAQYKTSTSGSNFTAPDLTRAPGVPGRRVMILPIMKKSSWWLDENDPKYETAGMQLNRYAAFFMTKKVTNAGALKLEAVADRVVVGSGSYQSTAANSSAAGSSAMSSGLAVAVLYR